MIPRPAPDAGAGVRRLPSRAFSDRPAAVALGLAVAIYMVVEAYADGRALGSHGFGSDFRGTIWLPDRDVLHGLSPYAAESGQLGSRPAVYLPPIYLVTLPLGWISLHLATWLWFAALLVAALLVPAALGVRDPWWYLLFVASLPVEQSLVLGNVSVLLALGAALVWRLRARPILCPLFVAATVAVKFWLWPLAVWLLLVRPRAGLRACAASAVLVLGAWAAIDFHGLTGYPALMRAEAHTFAPTGALFVALLAHGTASVGIAAALGVVAGLLLLLLAWRCRDNETESFSLVILAGLVATPVAWPHYLILASLPLLILWRERPLAWAWFPALWLATDLGIDAYGANGERLALCLLATVPVVIARGSRAREDHTSLGLKGLTQRPDFE